MKIQIAKKLARSPRRPINPTTTTTKLAQPLKSPPSPKKNPS